MGLNLRILHVQPPPWRSLSPQSHKQQLVSCWTVFTLCMPVLNFSHRYANQTRVINRSVAGIMQINKKRASGDATEIEECVSANLCWHSAERDSVVWKGWITALIIVALLGPDWGRCGEKVAFAARDVNACHRTRGLPWIAPLTGGMCRVWSTSSIHRWT